MAECAGRRRKKKKSQEQQEENSSDAEAVEFGDKDILKFLIAAQSDDVDTLKLYLENGMPVDTECLMFSDSALIKACRTGSVEAARLLLSWGANMATSTDDGHTALHIAVKNRQPDIIRLLFSHGAVPDVKPFTPLMLAASMSNTLILDILMAAGSDLDLQDEAGMTALHHCFNYYQERAEFVTHSVDCAKMLVAAGASVHIRDSKGKFPLTRAIEKLNMRGVKFLLAQNCDPDNQLCSPQGQWLSPLNFAVSINNHRLANVLWEAGCSCEGIASPSFNKLPWWEDADTAAVYAFSQPRTLKEACRKSVRDRLRVCGVVGPKLWLKVEELCIPKSLKDFVLLKDVLEM